MLTNDEYYDQISSSYEPIFKKRDKYIKSIDDYICNSINLDQEKTILDIGIGDGVRANHLIKKLNICRNQYYGIEPSLKMYAEAKKYFSKENLFNCDIENFKYSKGFDFIWCLWNVIGHVQNLDLFFSKLSKLIKKNGYIIFDFNNLFNIQEYGIKNYIKNSIISIITPKIKFELINGNNSTFVTFYKYSFVSNILKKYKLKIQEKVYFNYNTGKIERKSYNGQILLICKNE